MDLEWHWHIQNISLDIKSIEFADGLNMGTKRKISRMTPTFTGWTTMLQTMILFGQIEKIMKDI